MQLPKAALRITKPDQKDVLCGRGRQEANTSGTIRWQQMIGINHDQHKALSNKGRTLLCRSIVFAIVDRGGRFLQYDEESDCYFDIGGRIAVEKTSQAFLALSRKDGGADRSSAAEQTSRDAIDAEQTRVSRERTIPASNVNWSVVQTTSAMSSPNGASQKLPEDTGYKSAPQSMWARPTNEKPKGERKADPDGDTSFVGTTKKTSSKQ